MLHLKTDSQDTTLDLNNQISLDKIVKDIIFLKLVQFYIDFYLRLIQLNFVRRVKFK